MNTGTILAAANINAVTNAISNAITPYTISHSSLIGLMVKTYGPLGRYNRLGNPVPVLHVQSEEVYGVQTIDAVVPMSEQGGGPNREFNAVDKKVRSEKTDQILKGANPADIPFYQPTQLSLWSISKLRKIGLTVSEPLLTRADEVIE